MHIGVDFEGIFVYVDDDSIGEIYQIEMFFLYSDNVGHEGLVCCFYHVVWQVRHIHVVPLEREDHFHESLNEHNAEVGIA